MNYYDALRTAADHAGLTLADVSRATGHGRQYVNRNITRGSEPITSNAAAMLKPCGYVLAAVPADDLPQSALVID